MFGGRLNATCGWVRHASLRHKNSAIHNDILAVDIASLVACQPQRNPGNIFRTLRTLNHAHRCRRTL